jgi:hypothetical protein
MESLTLKHICHQSKPLWFAKWKNESGKVAVDRIATTKIIIRADVPDPILSSLLAANVRLRLVFVPLEGVLVAETVGVILGDGDGVRSAIIDGIRTKGRNHLFEKQDRSVNTVEMTL